MWGKKKVDGAWVDMTDAEKLERYGRVDRPPAKAKAPFVEVTPPQPEVRTTLLDALGPLVPTVAMLPITGTDTAVFYLTKWAGFPRPPLSFAPYVSADDYDRITKAGVVLAGSIIMKPVTPLQAYLWCCGSVALGAIMLALSDPRRGKAPEVPIEAAPEGFHPGAPERERERGSVPNGIGGGATGGPDAASGSGPGPDANGEAPAPPPASEVLPEPDSALLGEEGVREDMAFERVPEAPRTESASA